MKLSQVHWGFIQTYHIITIYSLKWEGKKKKFKLNEGFQVHSSIHIRILEYRRQQKGTCKTLDDQN